MCGPAQMDVFGEITGVAFSPAGDRFFASVADLTYSSLIQYDRVGGGPGDGPFRRRWQPESLPVHVATSPEAGA